MYVGNVCFIYVYMYILFLYFSLQKVCIFHHQYSTSLLCYIINRNNAASYFWGKATSSFFFSPSRLRTQQFLAACAFESLAEACRIICTRNKKYVFMRQQILISACKTKRVSESNSAEKRNEKQRNERKKKSPARTHRRSEKKDACQRLPTKFIITYQVSPISLACICCVFIPRSSLMSIIILIILVTIQPVYLGNLVWFLSLGYSSALAVTTRAADSQ